MNARERMLGRLRAAAPAQVSGDELKHLDEQIDLHYDSRRVALPTQALVESMHAALAASHAEVFRATEHTWPALIAQRLLATNVKRLLLDTSCVEGAALAEVLPSSVATRNYDQPIENWKAELFDTIDAGFTVARSGIASTGTLIVAPDASSPRTMSLVPPLHIALVYAHSLHADLHAAMRAEHWQAGMPTNLVMISGPSKTSDIQQTLAYGAHGPRELWVVIVEPQTDAAAATEGDAA
ncbi:lactate utilization protein C [Paraburkholderia caribensis]|uniref:LutC/YkgG family protein n=1 Tax=Paraburkholderia TaxID=1822464 RepID=UPI001CB556B6|nr:lactate utilization protein C [Paraburkholderia caribensis]BEU24497.1 lactate utilization protein C [Paraburkholderia sp. 22B1P]CAG9260566.1 Lactate utilization protein C [Paraburkholderia caribensis]